MPTSSAAARRTSRSRRSPTDTRTRSWSRSRPVNRSKKYSRPPRPGGTAVPTASPTTQTPKGTEQQTMTTIETRDLLDDYEAGEIAVDLDDKDPQEVIGWSLDRFRGDRIAICTSFQSDGMAILDMAWRIDPKVRVFTVDTGRMPAETYDLMERVQQRYGLPIEVYYPDATELEQYVLRQGINGFRRSVPLR